MSNPNFLILDEPTNDLDIFVMSVLEDYLRSFEGCLIVVSHDRYFMDKMVDHLFVFEGEGKIKDIIGNYTAYRKQIGEGKKDKAEAKKEEKVEVVKVLDTFDSSEKAVEKPIEKRKLSFKEKHEFETLEKELEKLEDEKAIHTETLSNASSTTDQLIEAGKKLGEIVAAIESKTERWMELAEFV
jgi:ATP-binding cassette subfamily F protein uup